MSGSKRRLSLIAGHLTAQTTKSLATPSRTASTAATSSGNAVKGMFRNREDYKYYLPIQTRWSDADVYAHINNSIYYHYFDTVINEYLIKNCGLNPTSTDTSRPIGLVVASQANFYASANYPNLIKAGLGISKIGKSSVTYRVGIFENDNPLACVVGGFTHVFVDPVTRKPVQSLPKDLLEGLEKIKDN